MLPGVHFLTADMGAKFIRPYGDELLIAKRYYENSFAAAPASFTQGSGKAFEFSHSAAEGNAFVPFKVTKRATPTMTIYDRAGTAAKITTGVGGVYTDAGTLAAGPTATVEGFYVRNTTAASVLALFGWKADATLS